jgi:hypothetical protein
MGNFSRDPQVRLTDAISKQYVGVRLQQGVPLLDADWNELEDLRRHDTEELGTHYIGSGVPYGSDGFRMLESADDNTFLIRDGSILIGGKRALNSDTVAYDAQPNSALVENLAAPGADITLIAYLDAWEREVNSMEDEDIVDARIGMETTVRMKREWAVRVAAVENPEDLAAAPPGHVFYPLARIRRIATQARITFDMIEDLRRLDLSLAQSTKAPLAVYGSLGTVTFDLDNFAQLMEQTASAYASILQSDLFMKDNFAAATPLETVTIAAVFGRIAQTAQTAELQARIRNLSNTDGILVLRTLYFDQDNFVTNLGALVESDTSKASTENMLEDLRELLDGGAGGVPPGLRNAVIVEPNLPKAIEAQQLINVEVGNRTQSLPHGHLNVTLAAGPPPETNIEAGQTYRFTFSVAFEPRTPGPPVEEIFQLRTAMNPPGWPATFVDSGADRHDVAILTRESTNVRVDIDIPAGTDLTNATLELNARSQNNPTEMNTTNTEVNLIIGSGSSQPNPVNIDLISPPIDPEEDTVPVGRGGPVGLPGRGINFIFRFTFSETVEAPVAFTASFVSNPPGAFEDVADINFSLGSTQGEEVETMVGYQATAASANGTGGTLTVTMTQDDDEEISDNLTIQLVVQKS